MKNVNVYLKKMLTGYYQLLLRLLAAGGFLLFLAGFNYLVVYPLRNLAVNQRLLYNILTLTGIAVLLSTGIVKSIIRVGLKQSLYMLGTLAVFCLLLAIPRSLGLINVLLACLYLPGLHWLIRNRHLDGGRKILFLILCFFNGFYRISIVLAKGRLWLAIPAGLYFIAFLGIILYENLPIHQKVDL